MSQRTSRREENGGSNWRQESPGDSDEVEDETDAEPEAENQEAGGSPDKSPMGGGSGDTTDISSRNTIALSLIQCIVCVITGLAFGFLCEKARVFEPINIRGVMIFKKLGFAKLLAASVSSGMFGLSLMAMLPVTNGYFQQVCIQFYGALSNRGIMACALGGATLGVGMTLSGSDPVLAFVQLGANVPNTEYVIGGTFIGTLVFVLIRPLLLDTIKSNFKSSSNPWIQSSYFITALPLVAMFSMLVFAFELLVPWTSEVRLRRHSEELGLTEHKAWPPFWCGVAIGLLQVPLLLGARTVLGGSTVYSTVLSLPFVGPLRRRALYLSQYKQKLIYWLQVLFILSTIFGAYTSASTSEMLGKPKGVIPVNAIVGGILMGFGANLAGGSTVLHGVTGLGLLSILSFITMAMMFIGGIFTATLFKQFAVLTPQV